MDKHPEQGLLASGWRLESDAFCHIDEDKKERPLGKKTNELWEITRDYKIEVQTLETS